MTVTCDTEPRTSPSHSPERLLPPDVCPVFDELFCFQEAWCWTGDLVQGPCSARCGPTQPSEGITLASVGKGLCPPTAPLSFLPWGKPMRTQILVSALLLIQVVTSDNLSIFML